MRGSPASLRARHGLATDSIRLLLDAVPDPLIVTDTEGDIRRASRSASHLLGYDISDLEGRPLSDLISEELRQEYRRHRTEFLASGSETGPELETRFVTADGSLIPIDASVGRLHIGEDTYVLLVLREVSDRLATQSRLERMVAIDDLTMSISSRLNTPDFHAIDREIEGSIEELATFCEASAVYLYIESNPGSFTLHSRSTGESTGGLPTIGLVNLPWIRRLLDSPSISEVATIGPLPDESEADCLRLAEQGVTFLTLIPLRASGRTIGFAGIESSDPARPSWPREDLAGLIVLQDVLENALERKRTGSELHRVNRALQAVSECHDSLIRAQDEKELLQDVCRIVVQAGGYALAWVGYALDDDSKRIEAQARWGDNEDYVRSLQLSWDDRGVGRGPAGTTIRNREPCVVQDTASDAGVVWDRRPSHSGFLSLVTVPVFYGNEVAGVLAVYDRQARAFDAQEVTVLQRFADDLAYGIVAIRTRDRQREAESQLRDLLRSKDELIATIAHELRTPLAGVVGFAQVLRDDSEILDPDARSEMIRLVAEQGMDLTNIVDDLLVAAKSEAGTLEVARVRVDLRAQAAQVLEAWGSEVRETVAFEGSTAITTGDPARVRQILRNLVTNALRYGGEEIAIHVGCNQGAAFVRVEDNGPGVSAEEQEKIFEPYSRAHDAPGLTASMGLGLSISRRLANLMGGELGYARENGLSVFTLSMPAQSE